MLTPLQQRLLDVIGQLPEAAGFALAGGAALIVRGTVDRKTNDLGGCVDRRQPQPVTKNSTFRY
ncbi:MAG: hypothetical protein EA388_12190 [Nitriliruptor sp.]|nr:MAG: hypothetical protein EA388_12190 [Nitriliruptor sp.]